MRVDLAEAGRITVEVSGRPRTKGSLKPVHRKVGPGRCAVSLTEDGKDAVTWKNAMIRAIQAQCVVTRYPGPVAVEATFRFGKLCEPDHGMPCPTRAGGQFGHGDVDKLLRNLLDALTQSGLIADDSNVVSVGAVKRWVHEGERPGVRFEVRTAGCS